MLLFPKRLFFCARSYWMRMRSNRFIRTIGSTQTGTTTQISKQFYFKRFSLASAHSLNIKKVVFQVIQLSTSTHFNSIWPIDRTLSSVTTPDLGAMAMKWCFAFPKAPTLPSDCLMSYLGHSLGVGVLPLCRDAVGVFYSSGRLVNREK